MISQMGVPCCAVWLCLLLTALPGAVRGQCDAGERVDSGGCEACPAGKFGDGTAAECTPCTAGTYASSGASSCTDCPEGKSAAEAGTEACSECAEGTHQLTPGQANCIDCPAGKVATSASTACEVCPPGRYSSARSSMCKTCPGGYRCAGHTDKVACGVGEYSLGRYPAVYTPEDASDDYTTVYEIQNVAGPTLCQQCGSGLYTPAVASRRAWDTFPQDWVCGSCDPGYECVGGSDKQICPAGKYAPGVSQACIDCPAGQYSSAGAAMCITCEAGHYCPGKLLTSASRCCPAGLSVTPACPVEAQTYPTDPAGICTRELSGGERVSSLLCIPGTFSVAGQTSCENCAPGQYSYAGSDTCLPCSPGYFCAGGPVSEVAPRENDAAFADTSLQLSLLHANQQLAPPDDLSSRQQCPAGTWSNVERLLDTSGDTSVLAWCSNCSTGMVSEMGASSCTNCTAGKYSRSGWPACQVCNHSSYCPGGTDAIQCPPGFGSDKGAVECTGCLAGKYSVPGVANCTDCDAGFWCPGSADKVPCRAGTWSNGIGASSNETCEPCGVPDACLSASRCRNGHRGDFCLSCQVAPSPWYASKDLCVPCPTKTTPIALLVAGSVFLLVSIIMLCIGSAGRTRSTGVAGNTITVPFSILFTNLQLVMKIYELNLRWPQLVLAFVQELRAFVELDLVSLSMTDPACIFKFENGADGYWVHQILVLLMLPGICLCTALLHRLWSCARRTDTRSGNRIRALANEVANACVATFCLMFMGITATSLEAFHCTTRLRPQPHLDQNPNVMCDSTGSYSTILTVGLLTLIFYVLGLPVIMFIALSGRNLRWVPLDKDNYDDPPNSIVTCWRVSKRNSKICWVKTTMCPTICYTDCFQDEETLRIVKEELAKRIAAVTGEHVENTEVQLETRMRGGCDSHAVCTHDRAMLPELSSEAVEGNPKPDPESESKFTSAHLSLNLAERIRGGKKAKKAAIKAAREAAAAPYKDDSEEEEKVVKKKIVKKKPPRAGPPTSFSYKDSSCKDDATEPAHASSMVRSVSSRKLRSDLLGSTPALRSKSFADLHHAKDPKKKKEAKFQRPSVLSTKSWLEQAVEGETRAAKSFRDPRSQSLKDSADGDDDGSKKSHLKSESFQKRMSKIKSVSIRSQGSFRSQQSIGSQGSFGSFRDRWSNEESEAEKRAALKLKYAGYKGGWCRRGPPEYDVDELETDGYIYWHEGTRQTFGWVYLRFRPECWWFEFVFMARKVAVVAVTTYLGNTGEGYVAWIAITMITVVAAVVQGKLLPFPEDRTARYSKAPCSCCSSTGLCSPHRGLFRCPTRAFIAFLNPSANDLEFAGLMCQLVTLICGLGCLILGQDDTINSGNTGPVAFVLAAVPLCAMLVFVVVVLNFWCTAVRQRGLRTQVAPDADNAEVIDDIDQDESGTTGRTSTVVTAALLPDVEPAGNEAGTESQPGQSSEVRNQDGASSKSEAFQKRMARLKAASYQSQGSFRSQGSFASTSKDEKNTEGGSDSVAATALSPDAVMAGDPGNLAGGSSKRGRKSIKSGSFRSQGSIRSQGSFKSQASFGSFKDESPSFREPIDEIDENETNVAAESGDLA